jgi:hypothetical protein
MGMDMGVNPYPPVYMGDPVGLFLCRGYEYGVVIPGGYLPIAISNHVSTSYNHRQHVTPIVSFLFVHASCLLLLLFLFTLNYTY